MSQLDWALIQNQRRAMCSVGLHSSTLQSLRRNEQVQIQFIRIKYQAFKLQDWYHFQFGRGGKTRLPKFHLKSSPKEENRGASPTLHLVLLSVSGWAEPRGVTDTHSWTQSVSSPNPTRANCAQMSSDIRQLTPSESNRENATLYHLASASAECAQAFERVVNVMSKLRRLASSLTSEVEVAQVVGHDLLGAFLSAQFDSAGEKDVPFPPGDDCVAFFRRLDVRHANEPRSRRAVRKT